MYLPILLYNNLHPNHLYIYFSAIFLSSPTFSYLLFISDAQRKILGVQVNCTSSFIKLKINKKK